MNKNLFLIKMFLSLAIPVFTFVYLKNSLSTILAAIVGFVLFIVLSIVLFLRKETSIWKNGS